MDVDFDDNNGRKAKVCSEWVVDSLLVKGYSYTTSISINVVNTILKVVLVFLITQIKED